MKKTCFILCCIILLSACRQAEAPLKRLDGSSLNPGDEWPPVFNSLAINHTVDLVKNNKLYVSTFNAEGPDYFFCFDLQSGKVLWKHEVSNSATFQPIVIDDVIYYVTYSGDRYAFDTTGKPVWTRNFANSKVSFSMKYMTFNPLNHNLVLSSVFGGFIEFDKHNGDRVSETAPCDSCLVSMSLPVFIGTLQYFTNTISDPTASPENNIPFNALTCRDYKNAKVKWSVNIQNIERLHAHEGHIYGYHPTKVYKWDGQTGKLLWTININPTASSQPQFLKREIMVYEGGKTVGIDYVTGAKSPFNLQPETETLEWCSAQNECYVITLSKGSIHSNHDFDDAWEVKCEKRK